MKRIPKSNGDKFRVLWTTSFKGKYTSHSAHYGDLETAKIAVEICAQQKSKFNIRMQESIECPDSLELQNENFRSMGARWDEWVGIYLYSASY